MFSEKRRLILSEGFPATIKKMGGREIESTILLTKAQKQFSNIISMESYRKALFVPELEIDNGDIVENFITGEVYIVITTFTEIARASIIATGSHLFVANTSLTAGREEMVGDARGNLKRSFVSVASDVPCHTQFVTAEVRQNAPGLREDAEYIIYSPAYDYKIMDMVAVSLSDYKLDLKIVACDYVTYPGVAVIQGVTETR